MVKQYKKDKKNRQKENNLMEFIYDEKNGLNIIMKYINLIQKKKKKN